MIKDDNLYLVDFGIAKALEGGKIGTMMGTAGYASPDQCRGNDSISNDIYSLGVLAHFLLTGLNPEDQSRPMFTFEPVRKYNQHIPEYIEKLVASMVEMRSADRPASVEQVRKAVKLGQKKSMQQAKLSIPPKIAGLLQSITYAPSTSLKTPPLRHALWKKPSTAEEIAKEEFFNAAVHGDVKKIAEGLQNGMEVNMKDKKGWTPLHDSAWHGHLEAVEFLIAQGAEINARDNDGWTPLHWATLLGRTPIVEYLIQNGADVGVEDNRGWTPLHFAVYKGHTDTAQVLVKGGSDIFAKDNDGWTPLNYSGTSKKSNLPDSITSTPVFKKISKEDFFDAAKRGDIARINAGVSQGLDINMQDEKGRTPLYFATISGHSLTAELLKKFGATG
jgi:ankyrin repeat protein